MCTKLTSKLPSSTEQRHCVVMQCGCRNHWTISKRIQWDTFSATDVMQKTFQMLLWGNNFTSFFFNFPFFTLRPQNVGAFSCNFGLWQCQYWWSISTICLIAISNVFYFILFDFDVLLYNQTEPARLNTIGYSGFSWAFECSFFRLIPNQSKIANVDKKKVNKFHNAARG